MKEITKIGVFVLVALIAMIIITTPIYFLWNWLVTSIFGLRELSLIETFGLIVLIKLLFGNNPTEKANNSVFRSK